MLMAMTFNVGIFFAVCIGLAFGYLVFGLAAARYTERLQVRTLLPCVLQHYKQRPQLTHSTICMGAQTPAGWLS
jgi:Ctr copper transporter family